MIRVCTILCLATPILVAGAAGVADAPHRVAGAAGVKGGLVVHIGCGGGRATAALRVNERYLVHGLDTDPAKVVAAREHIRALGLYGPVSADRFDGEHLPYADDLVNLVVADERGDVPMAEIIRVLAPGGVARIGGRKTVKPRPDTIDEWSHFLHGPDNNAVARDRAVGPPRRLKWACGPSWSRSHEFISSLSAMVTAGGRLFCVMDEGIISVTDPRLPERWQLIGRDAFNGTLLWKRQLPEWRGDEWRSTALRGRPASVPRRLVGDGDVLYATLSHAGPLEVLDAATGETAHVVNGTENTQEVLLSGRSLVLRIAKLPARGEPPSGEVVAVDADAGVVLWRLRADRYVPQTLAAANGRVVFHDGGNTVCLEMAGGRELWRAPDPPDKGRKGRRRPRVTTLVLQAGVVLACDGRSIVARDAETGRQRWRVATGGRAMRGEDMFVAHGRVWHAAGNGIVGYDLAAGEATKTIDPSGVLSLGHHLRCHRSKATESFIITQFRGAEFISLTGDNHVNNDWVRGPCRYGLMPANGLLYAPPDPCFCYPGAKLTGFLALAPAGGHPAPPASPRLQKGPAFPQIADRTSPISHPADWPTYRHDARRSGSATCSVPPRVVPRWQVQLRGRPTPPVVAGGRAYVAVKDEHTLYALSVNGGGELWHFTAGGRIDSPPAIRGDQVLFGCADGCVYCLRAVDGQLAWRFRAAPLDERIVASNQLESPWRVHGSVLVTDGGVYCTAGRSTFLDGGIRVYGLNPDTGEAVHEACLDTWAPTRADAEGKPFVPAYHMEGALSDILVSEDGFLYLGQYKFDRDLVQQDVPYGLPDPERPVTGLDVTKTAYTATDPDLLKGNLTQRSFHRYVERTHPGLVADYTKRFGGANLGDRRMGRHLMATGGFLDDSWFNRTYWIYADVWPGWYHAHRGAKCGQLLVVGREQTYAVQAYPTRNRQSPLFTPGGDGYLLLADRNATSPVLDDRTRGATKGIGFTRTGPPLWSDWVSIRVRAMVEAGEVLFVAGAPDTVPDEDPMAALDGRRGGVLRAVSTVDGTVLSESSLSAPPVFDGLIAAAGRLFVCTEDNRIVCMAEDTAPVSTGERETLSRLQEDQTARRERHEESARGRTIGPGARSTQGPAGKRLPKDSALPREGWRVVHVSTVETTRAEFAPDRVLDGDPMSSWHSKWAGGRDPFPHEIAIDLGKVQTTGGVEYLPRQDRAQNGRVKQYALYLSADGKDWGAPVAQGTFEDSLDEQRVSFAPAPGRYLRLVVLSGYDKDLTAIAELNVLGQSPSDSPRRPE